MAEYIDRERFREVVHRNTVGDLFDQLIDMQPTADVIPIPEGATIIDMIMTMFPNCRKLNMVLENEDGEDFEISFDITSGDGLNWNAPYKQES